MSIEEAGSEKIKSAVQFYYIFTLSKELRSGTEWRREGLQSHPCPNQAGRKKTRDIFFQSQPPQCSTVAYFGQEKRMHANEDNTLPTGMDTEIMKSFVEIAKKMGQSSEIMNDSQDLDQGAN